jgi:hypothetical protein
MDLLPGTIGRAHAALACLFFVQAACDNDTLTVCHSGSLVGASAAAIIGGKGTADQLALDAREESAIVQLGEPGREGDIVADLCSGVMISPTFALSAAHCVGVVGSTIAVGAGESAPSVSMATVVAVHPELDLALSSLPDSSYLGFVPIPLASRLPRPRELLQIAGFGLNDSGGWGQRRFAVQEVVEVLDDAIVVDGGGQSGACAGDSGGPLLTRDVDGSVAVAGILTEGSRTCVTTDVYVRVDVARAWIASYADLATPTYRCGKLDTAGRCINGLAVWCDDGERRAELCDSPRYCGWDESQLGFRCTITARDPCRGVDNAGECDGDTALRCVGGELESWPCAACGGRCERSPATGQVGCAPITQEGAELEVPLR